MTSMRDQFYIDPNIIFLNHGSFGATPKPVFERYQQWQLELERQPVEFLGRRANGLLAEARQSLGRYLHTAADNLVYVTNATTGLNIIARSLHLGPGDQVLTTDHEYGALDRTWRFLSKKQGFEYISHPIQVPVQSRNCFIEDFWQAVTPQTRVIFISQITSPTAMIFPIEEICSRARAAGILTVIDGAHAPGQIPLDLDHLQADFYSGNLHKWLCAPKGSAFLYAHPSVQHLVEPLIVSWGYQSESPSASQFVDYLEWSGTRDISPFLTVPAAIQFLEEHHWDEIRPRCQSLVSETQRQITALTGIQPLHPDTPEWTSQMGASPLPKTVDAAQLKARLYDEYSIEIPIVLWKNQPMIRYSYQVYNDYADLEALIAALKTLL